MGAVSPYFKSDNGEIWREGTDLGHPPPPLILQKKLLRGICRLGEFFAKNSKFFAIFSYLSQYFYTDNVIFLLKRTEDLGIHRRHKISSESLKGPAGIALPRGGDAY